MPPPDHGNGRYDDRRRTPTGYLIVPRRELAAGDRERIERLMAREDDSWRDLMRTEPPWSDRRSSPQ